MAAGQQTNQILVPEARNAMDRLKYEAAAEVGITPPASGYWGDIPSRQNGAVGGAMVRKMIQLAEQQLAGRTGVTGGGFAGAAPTGGFAGGATPAGTTPRVTR